MHQVLEAKKEIAAHNSESQIFCWHCKRSA